MIYLNNTFFAAGYCTHNEWITRRGGAWASKLFPAICTLIHHPDHGYILFDTGYTERFNQHTKKWPFWLYQKATPVHIQAEQTLKVQLERKCIRPEEIRFIIISHFHADHIGGLRDFPQAQFICSKIAYEAIREESGFRALIKGYLAGLLPDNFESRLRYIEDTPLISLKKDLAPFQMAYDLFGDGSCMAIFLPGHAKGQIGLTYLNREGQRVFLVADSCWSTQAFKAYELPSPLTRFIHDNWDEYKDTLLKLHILSCQRSIKIIPSHCNEIACRLLDTPYA